MLFSALSSSFLHYVFFSTMLKRFCFLKLVIFSPSSNLFPIQVHQCARKQAIITVLPLSSISKATVRSPPIDLNFQSLTYNNTNFCSSSLSGFYSLFRAQLFKKHNVRCMCIMRRHQLSLLMLWFTPQNTSSF